MRNSNRTCPLLGVCALLITSAAVPLAGAANVANGDFQQQFNKWKTDDVTSAAGIFASDRSFSIANGSIFGGDTNVAALNQNLYAEGQAGKAGFLDSEMILFQEVKSIPGTTLSLKWGAAFGITLKANGFASYTKGILVENLDNGALFEQNLVHSPHVQIPRMCPLGVAIDGAAPYQAACFDLSGYGFAAGDDVRISFISHIRVQGDAACDSAAFTSMFNVDEITFTDCTPAAPLTDGGSGAAAPPLDGLITSEDLPEVGRPTTLLPGIAAPAVRPARARESG